MTQKFSSSCLLPAVGSCSTGQPEGGTDSRTVFLSNVSVSYYHFICEAEKLPLLLFTNDCSRVYRYILLLQKMLFPVISISLELCLKLLL